MLLTALLVSPLPAAAKSKKVQPAPGSTLTGKITGSDGKPLRGAVVLVHSLDSEASWTSAPADRRGKYVVKGMHYGWAEVTVKTETGSFLGDQAMNLPPGKSAEINFSLIETRDKPASWWADRRVEPPKGEHAAEVAGMVQSSQKLTGVEYWKSPAGIAIIVAVGAVALAFIASGGSYKAPASTTPVTPITP
ncbi:MAG TPA: carboxypeptidase-like regulatory domain-containing protein [Candidatus Polarisedimenticolaceae bacterium]|nr:carboxypeptidase-like regulatory domain-containing protein [Candidatus Polarisedimenticolaceae bacterium]